MSEMLPQGWIKTTIADISVYIQRGKSPKYIDYSSLPVINQKAIRWNGLIEGCLKYIHPNQINEWSPERYIQPGDILWNSTGTGTIGRACYLTAEMAEVPKVVDSHVTIVRISPYVASIFCFRYIQSHHIQNIVESLYTGSTNQVELSKEKINAIKIPLPPLNEQKRIVAKLDATIPRIDSVKARLEKIPVIIKRFRQSVLTAAVTGKLTEKWREEHPEVESWGDSLSILPNKLNDSYLNIFEETQHSDLPTTWIYAPLTNLGRIQGGGTPSKSNLNFWKGNIPWISPKDMKIDRISTGRDFISKSALNSSSVKLLPEKSILFVVRGMILAHTFPVALTQNEVTINQDMKGITPSQAINTEYLFLVFKSIQGDVLSYVKEATHGTLRLEMPIIQTYAIPLPPFSEQKEIVRQVDRLFALADKLEAHYNKAKARVDKLSQSVLAKAFRGELVPQDPNDEPAEKLLERIMAEKAKMEGGGRQKAWGRRRRAKV
jgi:type I restriction enzyme S subunit